MTVEEMIELLGKATELAGEAVSVTVAGSGEFVVHKGCRVAHRTLSIAILRTALTNMATPKPVTLVLDSVPIGIVQMYAGDRIACAVEKANEFEKICKAALARYKEANP